MGMWSDRTKLGRSERGGYSVFRKRGPNLSDAHFQRVAVVPKDGVPSAFMLGMEFEAQIRPLHAPVQPQLIDNLPSCVDRNGERNAAHVSAACM